jgi:ribonuclease BN (tRNA processing enzyme)
MRVMILGVGDAFTAKFFGSSAVVEGPDGFVLIDCPDLIHRALRSSSEKAGWKLDATMIHDVIVTHLHGDHCNGLESFGFARLIRRKETPGADAPVPRVHTSRLSAGMVWERLRPAMGVDRDGKPTRQLEEIFDVRAIDPSKPASIAGLTVHCRFTQHPIPCIGLKISDGRNTLGWSGDTPYEQAHIDWLSDADVIVHECNVPPAHTPIENLNAQPDAIRRKMRLIHLPDDFDASATDIVPLREGDVLEL